MNPYAIEHWPEEGIRFGTVHYKDKSIEPGTAVATRVMPDRYFVKVSPIAHPAKSVDIDHAVYAGLVKAMIDAEPLPLDDEDDQSEEYLDARQKAYLEVLGMVHFYLGKFPTKEGYGFYLRDRDLFAKRVRNDFAQNALWMMQATETWMVTEEVFQAAFDAIEPAKRKELIYWAVYQACMDERFTARVTRLLLDNFPDVANGATIALWYEEIEKLGALGAGTRLWELLTQKREGDTLPLPAGFES